MNYPIEMLANIMFREIMNTTTSLLLFIDSGAQTNLQQFESYAELIFSILTKLFITGLVAIAIVYIVRVLLDRRYSIRHVQVPDSLVQAGHSGPVIANRIFYRIQQIMQSVSAAEYVKGYSTMTADDDVSVDVGGMGLPIKGFVELLGGALGIHRSKKVDVDFFFERGNLVMLLKISGHEAERFETAVEDSVDQVLKKLIFEAAEAILKYSNDEILQSYFGLIEQIGDKQVKLARYRVDKYRNNPKIEINAIAALAWGFCMLKKYDEAEAVIKEGIARHKVAGRIYVIWGLLYSQIGKEKEALEKFQIALQQATRKETKARISNVYASMGNCYIKLGDVELAIKNFEKAIAIEPRMSRPYFNLAVMYLDMKHPELFYENIEKALERGFNVQILVSHPKVTELLNEPKLKQLLERYAE